MFARLKTLGLPPSPLAEDDDSAAARDASTSPAGCRRPEETRSFLASKDADRYEQAVDRLLASPDYAYYFAGKWGAVLRNRRKTDKDDPKTTFAFHAWISDSLQQNKPFDQFVREILTATGPHNRKNRRWPGIARSTRSTSRSRTWPSFSLASGSACARCHHHPFEKWSQQDYHGLAAFFTRVQFIDPPPAKKAKDKKATPPRPPMTVSHKPGLAEALNPRTGKMVRPAGLDARELTLTADEDPADVPGRLDGRQGQSVFRPHPGQSLLEAFHGPGPGRAGRRHARHQSAHQSRAARRPGQAFRRQQVRPEEAGADDLHLEASIGSAPSRTSTTRATRRTTRASMPRRLNAEVLLDAMRRR